MLPRWTRTEVLEALGLATVAVGVFVMRFGWSCLDPSNISWPLAGEDPAMFFLGWEYFRSEPWSWPPGGIAGYAAPLGTSIAMVDAIPAVAIPLKLVNSWLPRDFQYLGAWMGFSAAMQAIVGYAIVRRVTDSRVQRVCGTILILLFPPLLKRFTHVALASHWLLLAALGLALFAERRLSWARVLVWTVLVSLTSAVHPYLTVMVLGIAAAAWFQVAMSERGRGRWSSILVVPGLLMVSVVTLWCCGYFVHFGDGGTGLQGFGVYSLNLNAMVNPQDSSALLADRPLLDPGQWEGMAYAGAGMLVLGLVAIAGLAARPSLVTRWKPLWPLAVVLLVFAVFAPSHRVSFDDRLLFTLPVPEGAQSLVATLRSSGRFLWPALYAGWIAVIWVVVRSVPSRMATALLIGAVAVQAYDLTPSYDVHGYFEQPYETILTDPRWDTVAARVERIDFWPPLAHSFRQRADYKHFAWLGVRHDLDVMIGHVTRPPRTAGHALSDSVRAALAAGRCDPDALYVVAPVLLPGALAAAPPGWRGDRWNGYDVLVPPGIEGLGTPAYACADSSSLVQFLADHREGSLLLAARDEASAGLTEDARAALRSLGCPIDDLAYRGSFAAVIADGRTCWSAVSADGPVERRIDAGEVLSGWVAPRDLYVLSAGLPAGKLAVLDVDGRGYSFQGRGLNVVWLDVDGRVGSVAVFDTHAGTDGVVVRFSEPSR